MKTRILLADDNADVGNLVKQVFLAYQRRRGGDSLDFVFVETGQAAVDEAKESPFDLVLMDYRLPPGNEGGVWAAEQIRRSNPDTPIIFLSSCTGARNLDAARQTGARGYIAKTFFSQLPVVRCLIDRDWQGLQHYADDREVWVFS